MAEGAGVVALESGDAVLGSTNPAAWVRAGIGLWHVLVGNVDNHERHPHREGVARWGAYPEGQVKS
jgi:hypothetical protein